MESLISCGHCKSTGTCTSGATQTSCAVCIKHHKIKDKPNGLVCSVCGGLGKVEPKTLRLQNRITPFLAILIVYFVLILLFANVGKPDFDKLLAFGGTLIGSITGYYFGGKQKKE